MKVSAPPPPDFTSSPFTESPSTEIGNKKIKITINKKKTKTKKQSKTKNKQNKTTRSTETSVGSPCHGEQKKNRIDSAASRIHLGNFTLFQTGLIFTTIEFVE